MPCPPWEQPVPPHGSDLHRLHFPEKCNTQPAAEGVSRAAEGSGYLGEVLAPVSCVL